ncbi:MAG: Bbp16 family capsid cement protein [Beijerinckiaceae bacterium]
MIIDSRLQVSNNQALTATAASTDVVDLSTLRNVGPGDPIYFVVVTKSALGGTSPTFAFSIQTDDNSGFSSAATIATSATFSGAAALPNGTVQWITVPASNERYLRANYTMGGTSPTLTVDGFFTNQEPRNIFTYPDSI